MIITKDILDQKVPEDMIPTRLDSALNLYTNIHYKDKTGIIVYNTNPDTWNCLYPFYELNHKFTIDNYNFNIKNPTYGELIEEYKSVYQNVYEQEMGYNKNERINILTSEYKNIFNLKNIKVDDELSSFFELKYSKSKNVWTLYYFENYVASSINNIHDLLKQNIYEQKILPLDASINNIDGVDVVSNLPYLLKDESNIEKLNNNLIEIVNS